MLPLHLRIAHYLLFYFLTLFAISSQTILCEQWFDDDGWIENNCKQKINDQYYVFDTTFLIDHRELFTNEVYRDSLGIVPGVTFEIQREIFDPITSLQFVTYQQYICGYPVEDAEIVVGLIDCFVASIHGNVVNNVVSYCEQLIETDSIDFLQDEVLSIIGTDSIKTLTKVVASINRDHQEGQCYREVVPAARINLDARDILVDVNGEVLSASDNIRARPAPTYYGSLDVSGVSVAGQLCTYSGGAEFSSSEKVMVRDVERFYLLGCGLFCPDDPFISSFTSSALSNNPSGLEIVERDLICIDSQDASWPPDNVFGFFNRRTYGAFALTEAVYDFFDSKFSWTGPRNVGRPLRVLTGYPNGMAESNFGFVRVDEELPRRDVYFMQLGMRDDRYMGTVPHEYVHLILMAGFEYGLTTGNKQTDMLHEAVAASMEAAFIEDFGWLPYGQAPLVNWLTNVSQLDLSSTGDDYTNGSLFLTVTRLMAQGGSNGGVSVPSIGVDAMSQIMWHTSANKLVDGTTVSQFADMLIMSATEIFGECSIELESTVLALNSVGLGINWGSPYLTGPGPLCAELTSTPGNWPPHIRIDARHNYGCPGVVTEWRFPFGWVNSGNIPDATFGDWPSCLTFIDYPTNTPPHYPKSYIVRAKVDGVWKRFTIRFKDCYGPTTDPDPCGGFASTNSIDPLAINSTKLITLYPNPVADVLNVYNILDESTKYRIVATSGKIVSSGIVESRGQIDLSILRPGLYVFYDISREEAFKFIKN